MAGEFLGPRLSRRDIADLDKASEALKAAATDIQRARPAWEAGAVHAIITANDIVERIMGRGLRAIERHVQKHGIQAPQDASLVADRDDSPNPDPNYEPEKA
jgi:hypothetical protein